LYFGDFLTKKLQYEDLYFNFDSGKRVRPLFDEKERMHYNARCLAKRNLCIINAKKNEKIHCLMNRRKQVGGFTDRMYVFVHAVHVGSKKSSAYTITSKDLGNVGFLFVSMPMTRVGHVSGMAYIRSCQI
jgi:hypothetical protein